MVQLLLHEAQHYLCLSSPAWPVTRSGTELLTIPPSTLFREGFSHGCEIAALLSVYSAFHCSLQPFFFLLKKVINFCDYG